MKRNFAWPALLVVVLFSGQQALAENAEVAAIKKTLAGVIPNEEPDSVRPAALDGMYEVVYGAQVMYISKDGRFVLQGDLIDLKTRENLTENARSVQRREVVAGLDEKDMIVFSPEGKAKHRITVFTDIDCGYCRKLHREIDDYLKQGIEVRYLAFPRSGKFSKSYYKAVAVWCANDRKAALTKAKSGEDPGRKQCDNPVDAHMAAADAVGVTGTPTMVFDDGTTVPGYVPAERLVRVLEQSRL